MPKLTQQIRECIESRYGEYKKFIIFPFGDVGVQVKDILNHVYGLTEAYILDNHLCRYNPRIKALSFLEGLDSREYCLLLSSTNTDIYEELKKEVLRYFPVESIAELSAMRAVKEKEERYVTKIGKYSYGPICCNHRYIESIGAFCSFAPGVDVVFNHEMNHLTTHPIIYMGASMPEFQNPQDYKGAGKTPEWYFEGVYPRRENLAITRRSRIGNDVWLGRNVIVTNYANIGNGVIAGAGTVITQDIPDYAIVVGAPARIIRYRYSSEEIESLNKIAWWDWSDGDIRERYDDLYLPVGEFIRKYLR